MNPKITKSLLYISKRIKSPILIQELAEEAGMSEFHFYRQFKVEMGITPQKYIEKSRLEYAAHLMVLQPAIKKIHLAFESGYSSPATFNRAFKSYFGINPSEYLTHQQDSRPKSGFYQQAEKIKKVTFNISYLAAIDLQIQVVKPIYSDIFTLFKHQYLGTDTLIYGIYLDAPFHKPIDECQYLLGTHTNQSNKVGYRIEAGYYLQFDAQGDFMQLAPKLIKLNQELNEWGYVIKEPIAFEKFESRNREKLGDVTQFTRKMYIPITKKQQDMQRLV